MIKNLLLFIIFSSASIQIIQSCLQSNFLRLKAFYLYQLFYLSLIGFVYIEYKNTPYQTTIISVSGAMLALILLENLEHAFDQKKLKGLWRISLVIILIGYYLKNLSPYLIWFLLMLMSFYILKIKRESFLVGLRTLNQAKYLAFLSAIFYFVNPLLALLFFFISLLKIIQLLEGFKVKLLLKQNE